MEVKQPVLLLKKIIITKCSVGYLSLKIKKRLGNRGNCKDTFEKVRHIMTGSF